VKKPLKKKPKETGWPVNFLMAEDATWGYDQFIREQMPGILAGIANHARQKIEHHNAMGSLHKLGTAGCDDTELLFLLGACENRGVQSAIKLTGYDSEELTAKLKLMVTCAQVIAEINRREFGLLVKDRRHFRQHERLSSTLRQYRALVEHAVKHLGGKTDFYLHVAKGRIIHYVREHTGSYHDSEVSELIAAALGSHYTEEDHRGWRIAYHKRIQTHSRGADTPVLRMKKTLLERRAANLYRSDSIGYSAPVRKSKKYPT
jgi:hypothetical protein